jgi:hypothetical protein
MPDPIQPVPSHPASSLPVGASMDLSQMREPFNADDYAHWFQKSLESKENADKLQTFLKSNNVAEQERNAFYDYVNQQARSATGLHHDMPLATIGGVNISPEDVLLMGGGAMGAAKGAAAGMRIIKGAAAGAAPIVKYEVAKYGLEKIGLPSPLATIAAVAIAGRSRRGLAPAAAEEAAAETAMRPAAAPAAIPVATPAAVPVAPSGPRTINEAMEAAITKARAEGTKPVATIGQAANAVQRATSTAKVKLTATETKAAMELVRQGQAPEAALETVVKLRNATRADAAAEFARRFGLPTEADVQEVVRAKNAETTRPKGGWKE